MIDINRLKKELNKYINEFDINDPQVELKIRHTYRVSSLSRQLATHLRLSDEDIDLAEAIGLLHDIGRFEQIRTYHTFIDKDSIDHGKLGNYILFEKGLINKMIEDRSYDNIIKEAIANHNKPFIKNGLSEREELHSKIIRDSDKTDILYLSTLKESFSTMFGGKDFVDEKISDEVYHDFVNNCSVDYHHIASKADVVLCHLAYIFDYNFKEMVDFIDKMGYVDDLYNNIRFNDQKTENRFTSSYDLVKIYMKNKKRCS